MPKQGWFAASFKEAAKQAVSELESQTSAEIVVAARPVSGHYRHVDFAVGSVAALVVLVVFLYHPEPFEFTYLPLELAGSWVLGTLLSLSFPPLGRALVSKKLAHASVELAASAAFTDCRVHGTRSRTGILVLISAFERKVTVRADLGVPVGELGEAWSAWQAKLEASVRANQPARFLEALKEIGPALGALLPRAADDVNELADDVTEAA